MIRKNFPIIERVGDCIIYKRVTSKEPKYSLAKLGCCGDYQIYEFSIGDTFFYKEDDFAIQHDSIKGLTQLQCQKLDLARSLGYDLLTEGTDSMFFKNWYDEDYIVVDNNLKIHYFKSK